MLSLLFLTDSTSISPGRQTNKIKRTSFELPVNRDNHTQRDTNDTAVIININYFNTNPF